MEVEYRKAVKSDFGRVVNFVDFWLTGGGKADGVPGSGHDFFVPRGLHEKYFAKYSVLLALYESEIVGWAVKTNKGVLIHLLVAGTFRGDGIGGEMLRRMNPETIRSKFDQSSGDPAPFYRKRGYVKASSERVGKKKNIDIFIRPGVDSVGRIPGHSENSGTAKKGVGSPKFSCTARRRSIDALAERLDLGPQNSDKYSY